MPPKRPRRTKQLADDGDDFSMEPPTQATLEDEYEESVGSSDQPAAKRRKTAKGKSVASGPSKKPKGTVSASKRRTGASKKGEVEESLGLKRILDMPLDIVYEILCHMEPAMLILLAQSMRAFRSVLMSRASSFVWTAARNNVPRTPPPAPPDGISEPAWANLLYTPNMACFECGKKNLTDDIDVIDFAFRKRLCLSCRRKYKNLLRCNRRTPTYIMYEKVLDLVPYSWRADPSSKCYWIPDLKAMQSKVAQLSSAEYEDFKKFQIVKVQAILDSVQHLYSWLYKYSSEKRLEKRAITDAKRKERYHAIVDRLVALNYTPKEAEMAVGRTCKYSAQPLTDTAWERLAPKLRESLDSARAARAWDQRTLKAGAAYDEFTRSLVPSQMFFVPREVFANSNHLAPQKIKLPCIERLLAVDPGTEISQDQFDELAKTTFFADVSTWALERMNIIAKAASLPIALPPSVSWVTLDDPERDIRLADLNKIFDLAAAVFIVKSWESGSSSSRNWKHDWPSLGPAPELPYEQVAFIGRDVMNIKNLKNDRLAFSPRGAKAIRAILSLENLDVANTTATELDARNALYKCDHCSLEAPDIVYTWRGCVVHYLKMGHTQPSWSRISADEAAAFEPDEPFPAHKRDWTCNHCSEPLAGSTWWQTITKSSHAELLQHVSTVHAIDSPQDERDLVCLPHPGECAPRVLSLGRKVPE
ncbi:hypothetical protein C8J57DRAFT_255027 [Mycena rebaudengoi]|nr:hypothetical protein C8J57DRAFT_255027 [Mycena rebaudengoi]